MKSLKSRLLAPFAAALGLGLMLAASSASAAINWGDPFTLFEDDDLDWHFDVNGNVKTNGQLEIGDVLAAVLELNSANGTDIGPGDELTGLAIIQLVGRAIVDVNGVPTPIDIFAPPAAGFDFYSGGAPDLTGGAGAAGGGAMIAFWLDGSPDLKIDAGSVTGGTTSCLTFAVCSGQASDGSEWLVAGFTGDPDEAWIVANAPTDVSGIPGSLPSQEFGALNASLGLITNGTGRIIILDDLDCGLFCGPGPGGDGKVDISGSGSVKGGGIMAGMSLNGEWFATSDFDMTLKSTVPVPGTVLLLGLGLLGLTTTARRKKA